MTTQITGFDNFKKELNRIQRKVKTLSKEQKVSFDELFTQNFMQSNTSVSSFDDFLKSGGYQVKSQEDFDAIINDEFDTYVKENTKFTSWQDMCQSAVTAYYEKKLKL